MRKQDQSIKNGWSPMAFRFSNYKSNGWYLHVSIDQCTIVLFPACFSVESIANRKTASKSSIIFAHNLHFCQMKTRSASAKSKYCLSFLCFANFHCRQWPNAGRLTLSLCLVSRRHVNLLLFVIGFDWLSLASRDFQQGIGRRAWRIASGGDSYQDQDHAKDTNKFESAQEEEDPGHPSIYRSVGIGKRIPCQGITTTTVQICGQSSRTISQQ